MATYADLVTSALMEIGVLGAGQTATAADLALGLTRVNRILNRWNAQRQAVYAEVFTTYTITPNLQPHTIGPSGATYTVGQRPVSVDGANIILNTVSPTVRSPLQLLNYQEWLNVSVPGVTTTLPIWLYYDPAWPNGNLYLWPVPTYAYGLELMTRVVLSSVTASTTFTLPPAYEDAIALTLAEDLSPAFNVPVPQQTAKGAREARALVFSNNTVIPSVVTADSGMPNRAQGSARSNWNWLTGLTTNR